MKYSFGVNAIVPPTMQIINKETKVMKNNLIVNPVYISDYKILLSRGVTLWNAIKERKIFLALITLEKTLYFRKIRE